MNFIVGAVCYGTLVQSLLWHLKKYYKHSEEALEANCQQYSRLCAVQVQRRACHRGNDSIDS